MNLRQRSHTPIKRINYPIINFEQLKKEQQYLDQAFHIYDTYQQNNEVFNSLRQIEKTIDLAARPNHRKLQKQTNKLNFSEIIERPKLKSAIKKEYLNCTFLLTNIYKEPELIWDQYKTRYGKREQSIKPARHPLKVQQSLDLNPQKYNKILSSKLRNWV